MLEDIKSIVNILFFLTAGIVGVLSYLNARKTLFAPIKTETFKLQLKAFEELLSFFQHKNEHDFLDDFDFPRILRLNALQMCDAYAHLFFSEKIEVDKEQQKKAYSAIIGALIKPENLRLLDADSHREAPIKEEPHPETPALALAKWQKYEHDEVGFTGLYQKQIDELNRFAASPLLPNTLRNFILRFRDEMHENLLLVGAVIAEAAKVMPDKFSTVDEVIAFKPDWIWNLYNKKRKNVEPTANEILQFINKYLNVEKLIS